MAQSDKPNIAVVCGGPSAEADISRVSGRGVAKALGASYSNVVICELDNKIRAVLKEAGVDVVFPVLHGPPGEDGTFQGFLEIMGIPYERLVLTFMSLSRVCAVERVLVLVLHRASRPARARRGRGFCG